MGFIRADPFHSFASFPNALLKALDTNIISQEKEECKMNFSFEQNALKNEKKYAIITL